jgi:hypothetical protein
MIKENKFELNLIKTEKHSYLDILIDGKSLSKHFVGRLGAHPDQISPLGWSTASKEYNNLLMKRFLLEAESELPGGRNPVLVCPLCGDIGCGAFTVRMSNDNSHVYWQEWLFENGIDENPEPPQWPTKPTDFYFDREQYEAAIRKHLDG